MKKTQSSKLKSGSRVGIIGGGPSGSFFALYLQYFARQAGYALDITIYEPKSFAERGSRGCNRCAGVLSAYFLRNFKELQIELPSRVIQKYITSYHLHSPYGTIQVDNPEPEMPAISIYRGGGPLHSSFEVLVSFDGYLLEQAKAQGVTVVPKRVRQITITPNPAVVVEGKVINYDLVVLAGGVNSTPIQHQNLQYIPPVTHVMMQDELYAGKEVVESALGSTVHIFLFPDTDIVFGSLVPKGPFINVSLLSKGAIPATIDEFLAHELVRKLLTFKYHRACGCKAKAVTGPAKNFFADGFVAIGDSSVSRLYKDGIGSALMTARQAALTAVVHGISSLDFKRYYLPLCRTIARDNWFGQALFFIHQQAKNSKAFLRAQSSLVTLEREASRSRRPFSQVIWGMFTGSYRYRRILGIALSPDYITRLIGTIIHEKLKQILKGEQRRQKLPYSEGKKRIVVLGGGFAGIYVLRSLMPALKRIRNLDLTLVSNENFFLFTPLLHEVATGAIETRHIAYPIRRLYSGKRFTFLQSEIQAIDLLNKQVTTAQGVLDYDYLVVALGSVTDLSQLPAGKGEIFTMKTLRDSMLLRNHIIRIFERANAEVEPDRQRQLLTFIVSGGGYTGVQLVAEISDFIHRFLVKYYTNIDASLVRIILVQDEDRILSGMHHKLVSYALRLLQTRRIEIRVGSRVTSIFKDCVEINGHEIVSTKTLVWVAGVVAPPVIAGLDVEKDRSGRVMVNEFMEVPGFPGVYAPGDNAHFNDPTTGQPLSPRAHIAVRQAKIVAANILAQCRGKPKKPYRYSFMGEMVSLGSRSAVVNFYGLRLYGFPARVIWLVAHSLLLIGNYNRIRVALDWFLALIFGRDTNLLDIR